MMDETGASTMMASIAYAPPVGNQDGGGNDDGDGGGNDNNDTQCTMPTLVGTPTTNKTAETLLDAVKAALTSFTGTPTGTPITTGTDTIQTQTPDAGSSVDCGTSATFTYKLPTKMCTVPSIVGMATNNATNRAAVVTQITQAELVVGTTSLSTATPRNVKSVTPTAGSQVSCGSSVSYVYND